MPFITPWKEKPLDNSADGSKRRVESGAMEHARRSILDVLNERFGADALQVEDKLIAVENPQRLTILMRTAVKVKALRDFIAELNR